MLKRLPPILLGLLCFSTSFTTTDFERLDYLFNQKRYDDLKNIISEYVKNQPNDPRVLFFRGFTHQNSDSAQYYYQRIYRNYPQSPYADHALYRLGQMAYFQGDYRNARLYLSELSHLFSVSSLKDDAQYLYCQCVLAQGKIDSAKLFLKAFIQHVSKSPYVDSAILDLESLGGLPALSLKTPVAHKSSRYSIEVGSFRARENASNAADKIARVYPQVEIGERELGNTVYYVIYIGKFDTEAKAKKYAELYINPHLEEIKIVERQK